MTVVERGVWTDEARAELVALAQAEPDRPLRGMLTGPGRDVIVTTAQEE